MTELSKQPDASYRPPLSLSRTLSSADCCWCCVSPPTAAAACPGPASALSAARKGAASRPGSPGTDDVASAGTPLPPPATASHIYQQKTFEEVENTDIQENMKSSSSVFVHNIQHKPIACYIIFTCQHSSHHRVRQSSFIGKQIF